MERSEVLDAMGQLKLYGMRASYDEIMAGAVKRRHEPQKIIGDLLSAEISEKQARSVKYQMTIAKTAARQGTRRVRLRGRRGQRDVGPRPGQRRLPSICSAMWC